MLRGQRPRDEALGKERARLLLPPRLQPPPRRRGPAVGLLQPATLVLGARLLRREAGAGEGPPRRSARARQPLARAALALPPKGRPLRRGGPRRQPRAGAQQSAARCLMRRELTEGVSLLRDVLAVRGCIHQRVGLGR